MKMKLRNYLILAIVLAAVAVIATSKSYASENSRQRGQVDVHTNTNVSAGASASSSNTMTTGNTNLGFETNAYVMGSHALGDVDINQCIVTHQKGSFVVSWQGYDYNLWCMGEVFDAKGLPHMGALMRCDIGEIRRHFDSDDACLSANTVVEHHNETQQAALAAVQDQFDDVQGRQDDELERVTLQQAMLYEQIEEQRVLIAQAKRPVIVQAEPALSNEQKEAVWQALKGDKK